MPFDGLMLASVCKELSKKISGGRIEKIYQPSKNNITMVISQSKNRQKLKLLISAHPKYARIHLTGEKRENPLHPPIFCMVLRKHIEGGYIKELRQRELDRVLEIHISTRDELGQIAIKLLICEIMGKHSNIILVEPVKNLIIDGIRRYSHELSRHREVMPGKSYIEPPSQQKHNPLYLNEDSFREIILNASLDNKISKTIQANLDGFSPLMSKEILYRAGLPEDMIINHCGEHELRVLWQALQTIIIPASEDYFNPTMFFNSNGYPFDFAAFDLVQYQHLKKKSGEPSIILDTYFNTQEKINSLQNEKQSLRTLIQNQIKKTKKKASLQKESANNAEKREKYKLYGELLTANMYQLRKGMDEIIVENFYDPAHNSIKIPLDPWLSPSENVQTYFRKYVKAKKTREGALIQAKKSREELNYFSGILVAIENATDLPVLKEIRQELFEQGYITKNIKEPFNHKKEKKIKKQQIKPESYISSDGLTIYVGRNNKQNDHLTMKIAKNEDIWLHAKDIPGSHVVIKTGGINAPDKTIYEAAVLAAYYSQARNSTNVTVDYTLKKNVRKPVGAKPGYVIYTQQRTAIVNPEEKLSIFNE